MLLADKSPDENAAPVDFFKQTRVPKAGEKAVPDKPSNISHAKNEDMLIVDQIKRGFKAQAKWSQEFKDFECLGDQRLLDKQVKEASAREQAAIDREQKLAAYYRQPQRGRRKMTVDPAEQQMMDAVQQPGA